MVRFEGEGIAVLPGTEQRVRVGPRREIHGRREADQDGGDEDDVGTDHLARLIDAHAQSSRDRDEHLQRELESLKTALATVTGIAGRLEIQVARWKVYAGLAGVVGGAIASGAVWIAVRLMVP